MNINKATEKLRDFVEGRRYEHSLRVSRLAGELARAHNLEVDRARLAGLLHDVAKQQGEADFRRALEAGELECDPETLEFPYLHHAPYGAYLARTAFGVEDTEILEAIRVHPTGAPGLGPVGLTVFVADFCEEGRDGADLETIREQAEFDLVEGALRVCEKKLTHMLWKRRPIHSRSAAFWNDLLLRKQKGGELSGGEGRRER